VVEPAAKAAVELYYILAQVMFVVDYKQHQVNLEQVAAVAAVEVLPLQPMVVVALLFLDI
jgi:hypothetical protein